MWWRCLRATLRWLLRLHGFHSAKPKAREESVSACAADNAASVTLRPKTVCWGVKANDGFVKRHAVTFKVWNGDGRFFLIISWTTSQRLSHSYFFMGSSHRIILNIFSITVFHLTTLFLWRPKRDFGILYCLHRMFYSTRFVTSLHLFCTPPQWKVLLYLLRPLPSQNFFHGKRHWQNREDLLVSRISYLPLTSGQDCWALGIALQTLGLSSIMLV